MKKYTNEELMQEFGEVELTLRAYFKYSFSYSGVIGNKEIYLSVGGDPDSIYRFEPKITGTTKLSDLCRDIEISYATIREHGNSTGQYSN